MASNNLLIDNYYRKITYLRISITDRCNLRCIYCNPKGNYIPRLNHHDILSYEEILHIVKIFIKMGIKKIRITGGEPFVRKDIDLFIKSLSRISGIEELTITTNGTLLIDYINILKECGIKRLNISLDTLKPERYKQITGFDAFKKVWDGIFKAKELGFDPIKINMVVLNGINDDEILEFAKLTLYEPFHVRFIEYMPIGTENKFLCHVPSIDIMSQIKNIGELIEVKDKSSLYPGPAHYFKLKNAKGMIGFISPITSHFCKKCNRIRLTADGHLKPCLISSYKLDIKTPLRNDAKDNILKDIIIKAVKHKPISYLDDKIFGKESMYMYMIGG